MAKRGEALKREFTGKVRRRVEKVATSPPADVPSDNVERLLKKWPKRIRDEIIEFMAGGICGHGGTLSREAAKKYRYLRIKYLAPMLGLILLAGCMTHFDHRIERAHREYLSFQTAHQSEFGQQAKRSDWEVGFWWNRYQIDRTNRGKVLLPGPDADWNREPDRGIWATFSGRCMIQEIEVTKDSWRLKK